MGDGGRLHLVRAGLVLAVLLVYARAVGFGFVGLDDPAYVTDNARVLQGLTLEGVAWALRTTHAANWHPLAWWSLMLDGTLGGGQPWAFHLTGILLHAANALLLLELLVRATGKAWRGGFVALVFAVHPLHVESVTWVSERKDVLCTFFWLLAMLAWLAYARRPSTRRYLLVLLAFVAALAAKPMPVTLPALLLLFDYWPLRRFESIRPGQLIREKVPLLALSATSAAITLFAQRAGGSIGSLEYFPPGTRLANAAVSYVAYIHRLFWPVDLAVYYPFRLDLLTPLRVSISAGLLVLATVICLRAARRRPYLAVGWLWYLVTLVPVIGLVQVGGQAMADRYTYVPVVGLLVVIAWGVPDLLRTARSRRPVLAGSALVVWAALSVLASHQVGYWRDTETLFTHTLDVTEENLMAHYALAIDAHERGEVDQALSHHTEALRIWPGFVDARTDRAAVLRMAGRPDEAATDYREALRGRPGDVRILEGLEDALIEAGRHGEAIELLERRLAETPRRWALHGRLAALLALEGRIERALRHFDVALYGDPDDVPMRVKLATVLLDAGRPLESAAEFRKVLELDPRNKSAHKNLGVLLARSGDLDGAIEHFEQALRADPDDEGVRRNLERARAMRASGGPL